VRHSANSVAMRPRCKADVHALLATGGIWVSMTDLFGVEGDMLLDKATVPAPLQPLHWTRMSGSCSMKPNWPRFADWA
jgi:hypothetical protein